MLCNNTYISQTPLCPYWPYESHPEFHLAKVQLFHPVCPKENIMRKIYTEKKSIIIFAK